MDDKIQKYNGTICNNIKWKNYHSAIKSELQNHIDYGVSDLIKQYIERRSTKLNFD